jgi:hypothetical protein
MATASRGENKFGENHSAMCGKWDVVLARFTIELETRRDFLSSSLGEKVAGTAG